MACQCFVSIDRGQLLQTTALDIREEKTAAVSILRRPDKLRHVAAVFAERTLGTLTPLYTRERFFRGVAAGRKVRDWLPEATVSERRSFKIEHERTTASMISYMGAERLKLGRVAVRPLPTESPPLNLMPRLRRSDRSGCSNRATHYGGRMKFIALNRASAFPLI